MTASRSVISLVPVLMGTARLPELSNHRFLLRHVVHDLELGRFERAIQTLDNAHAVFDLTPLSDLKRFIQNQAEAIKIEVRTTSWSTVARAINGQTERWVGLTTELSPAQLLKNYIDLSPVQNLPAPAVTRGSLENTHSVEQPAVTLQPSDIQQPRVQPLRGAQASQPRPSKPAKARINLRAAGTTFVLTLFAAILAGWLFN